MNRRPLRYIDGFKVRPAWAASFSEKPKFFELSGPGSLVRILQFEKTTYDGVDLEPSRIDGGFWFDGTQYDHLWKTARLDLLRQKREDPERLQSPITPGLIGNYIKHQLRNSLAVPMDYTLHFDAIVRLGILEHDRLVALVGPIKGQPVYSPKSPEYQRLRNKGFDLRGGATQFVIDFAFGPNHQFVKRISRPHYF